MVRNPEEGPRAVGDALVTRLLMTPLFLVGIAICAPFFASHIPLELLALATANGFVLMYLQSWQIGFEAAERMHLMAIGGFINLVVGMALSVAAVLLDLGPAGVMGARLLGNVCQMLFFAMWMDMEHNRELR